MKASETVNAARMDTIREMESHAVHLVMALNAADYTRAQFHAENASSCLRVLLQDMNRQIAEGAKP